MRNDALLRTLQVLRALQRSPRTLAELAESLSVHPRTIRRDLDVLSLCGFPIDADTFGEQQAVWRLRTTACPMCDRERAA